MENRKSFVKLLIGVWLLSTFVIMKSYEGNFTALITIPKVEIPIDSVSDLISQDTMPWKIVFGSWFAGKLKVN